MKEVIYDSLLFYKETETFEEFFVVSSIPVNVQFSCIKACVNKNFLTHEDVEETKKTNKIHSAPFVGKGKISMKTCHNFFLRSYLSCTDLNISTEGLS